MNSGSKRINPKLSFKEKTKIFIENAKLKHGDTYDYSMVKYNKGSELITIICKTHGKFQQKPHDHLSRRGCKQCAKISKKNKLQETKEGFIKKANLKHHNKYDYTKVIFVDNKTPVIIVCAEHGQFEKEPHLHKMGTGCPKCGEVNQKIRIVTDQVSFLEKPQKSTEIHMIILKVFTSIQKQN
jgi:hypothetical protein